MKTEFNYKNEQTHRVPCQESVSRVDVFGQTVTMERLWGQTPATAPTYGGFHCRVTRTYEHVSLASLQRVHDAVARLVNQGEAKIRLSQIGKWGLSYELEF